MKLLYIMWSSHLADYAGYFEELAANEGIVSKAASEVMRYQYRHAVASSGDNYKKWDNNTIVQCLRAWFKYLVYFYALK